MMESALSSYPLGILEPLERMDLLPDKGPSSLRKQFVLGNLVDLASRWPRRLRLEEMYTADHAKRAGRRTKDGESL